MSARYRVYIGAASTALETARARRCAEQLRAAGVEVVSTWWDVIAATGGVGNPRDATVDQRRQWSAQDLSELSRADALWLLCPPPGVTTRGAWVELGTAYARALLIVSSGDTRQSIFTAMGIEYETDEEALRGLALVAERMVAS